MSRTTTARPPALLPTTENPLAKAKPTTTQTTRSVLSDVTNGRPVATRKTAGTALQPRPTNTIVQQPSRAVNLPTKPACVKSSQQLAVENPPQPGKRAATVLETLGIAPHQKDAMRTRSSTQQQTETARPSKRQKSDAHTESTRAWVDIDVGDHDDPRMVSEYVEEIYAYLREKEQDVQLSPKFLSIQDDINDKMRTILVDWLVEVHRMFKLIPETLFLAISVLDKFLSVLRVERASLQLVGITSLLISSKYEEIYAPEIADIVFITDNAYTKEQILDCEEMILENLEFSLTFPSSLHYLRRFSKAAGSDVVVHTLCKYLCEVVLLDVKLLKFLPSEIAAGSVYLAQAMTNKFPLWNPTLEHYTGYTEGHVRTVAMDINDFLKRVQKASVKAIQKKYSSPKFSEVSGLPLVSL